MVDYTDRATATRIITPETPNEWIMLPTAAVYVNDHPPGDAADLHTHDEDHVLVMRAGRMRWTVDGDTVDTKAGDVILAPAGTQHGFEVLGDETVKLLCIETPNPEVDKLADPA
ncbi:MAG TPA: cupin domain-containing protein [Nitriliruptoraceae bacterium]|nr:cupin domain-containing protein [Nitriliruptoraceae bacterium]